MDSWAQLIHQGTLGMNKVRRMAEDGQDPIDQFWQQVCEHMLLQACHAPQAEKEASGIEAAPQEQQAYLPGASYGLFKEAFRRGKHAILEEALRAASQRKALLSPALLPALMDWAMQHPIGLKALQQLGGHRLTWLARQNPAWATLIPPTSADWEYGQISQRVHYLRWLREQDPAEGLALMQQVSYQEAGPRNYVRLLDTLRQGLSLADEAFLMSLHTHKRKKVRWTVGDLLFSLPESEISLEFKQQTGDWLARKKGEIQLQIPTEYGQKWLRLGLDASPLLPTSFSLKARLTATFLGWIPPQYWTEKWDISPVKLLRKLSSQSDAAIFWAGWLPATLRFEDESWAKALVSEVVRYEPTASWDPLKKFSPAVWKKLGSLVEPAWLDKGVTKRLKKGTETVSFFRMVEVLSLLHIPLSSSTAYHLSDRLSQLLSQTVIGGRQQIEQLIRQLPGLLFCLPPVDFPRLAPLWTLPPDRYYWFQKEMEKFTRDYSLRYRLWKAMEGGSSSA